MDLPRVVCLLFHTKSKDKQNLFVLSLEVFVSVCRRYDPYPEDITHGNSLSGVLCLCVATT